MNQCDGHRIPYASGVRSGHLAGQRPLVTGLEKEYDSHTSTVVPGPARGMSRVGEEWQLLAADAW